MHIRCQFAYAGRKIIILRWSVDLKPKMYYKFGTKCYLQVQWIEEEHEIFPFEAG